MFLTPVTEQEVLKVYKQCKNSHAIDYRGLCKVFFDKIIDLILPCLTRLCNLSFQKSIFPQCMKIAKVTPLYKSGERCLASNYRPISILPFLSKLLEKLFLTRLQSFIDNNNVITEHQYGFQKNRSTSLAVVDYYESVTNGLKNGKCVVSLSLDLSKAFDSIPHDILFHKLEHYGVRGMTLRWVQSYLSHRQQMLVINNTRTDLSRVPVGVAQGSILGPIMFLLYINDIINCSSAARFIVFADGTTVLYELNSSNVDFNSLNEEIGKISTWCKCNKLLLNVKKTQCTIYTPKRGAFVS